MQDKQCFLLLADCLWHELAIRNNSHLCFCSECICTAGYVVGPQISRDQVVLFAPLARPLECTASKPPPYGRTVLGSRSDRELMTLPYHAQTKLFTRPSMWLAHAPMQIIFDLGVLPKKKKEREKKKKSPCRTKSYIKLRLFCQVVQLKCLAICLLFAQPMS